TSPDPGRSPAASVTEFAVTPVTATAAEARTVRAVRRLSMTEAHSSIRLTCERTGQRSHTAVSELRRVNPTAFIRQNGTMDGPPPPGSYALRRVPTQDRASAQVERILDAACLEVTERGYDAASTSSVARRARIAVGSVYRYFPDKRALMQAVERRNQARYGEAVRRRLATVRDWRQAVDVTMDTFRQMHRTDPGF